MPTPNSPLQIISLGAGVQSSTMALMAAAGEITPMPDAAIFADTQDEPASVYKWLDWLEPRLPFPVHRVTAGSLSAISLELREHKKKKGKFWAKSLIPAHVLNADGTKGFMGRQCTENHKVVPIIRESRSIAAEQLADWRRVRRGWANAQRALFRAADMMDDYWHGFNVVGELDIYPVIPPPVVIQWIGISLDEVQRMKPAREKWIEHRWPLIDMEMKRHDCLRWMKYRGFPTPPRSACRQCPFHSNAEWRRLRDEEPREFALAVQFERQLQAVKRLTDNMSGVPFLHASLTPLDRVDLSTDDERGQGILAGFNAECEGLCGVQERARL